MAKSATKGAEATGTAEMQTTEQALKAKRESVYPVEDLAANARKLFGTRQECVSAALRDAGKTECAVSEAKEIVEKFLKREVK